MRGWGMGLGSWAPASRSPEVLTIFWHFMLQSKWCGHTILTGPDHTYQERRMNRVVYATPRWLQHCLALHRHTACHGTVQGVHGPRGAAPAGGCSTYWLAPPTTRTHLTAGWRAVSSTSPRTAGGSTTRWWA